MRRGPSLSMRGTVVVLSGKEDPGAGGSAEDEAVIRCGSG